jgi:hypothetical protein
MFIVPPTIGAGIGRGLLKLHISGLDDLVPAPELGSFNLSNTST